jgi:hypothetical protein
MLRVPVLLAVLAAPLSLSALDFSAEKQFWLDNVVEYCQGHPSKGECDDGDSTIFNGLLCLSGEQAGCDTVRLAQGSDGRWWRSPRRVDGNLGELASFSKDQSLGVMLYLVATRDTQAAQAWMEWMKKHRPCITKKPDWMGGGCLIRSEIYRYCDDDEDEQGHSTFSCSLTPDSWGLLDRVWGYLGLEKTGHMRQFAGKDLTEYTLIEARAAAPGYRLHLKAISALLREYAGGEYSRTRNAELIGILAEREPLNPFFRYMHGEAFEDIAPDMLEMCPSEGDDLGFRRHQWSWERTMGSRPWEESMGWECIFLANLMAD